MSDRQKYPGEDIPHYSAVEGIRKRPTLYLGDLSGKGVASMLLEAVCIGLYDCANGKASKLTVVQGADHVFSVEDNGESPKPTDRNGRSVYEILLTEIHACRASKQQHREFCTVGIVVTNAISEWLTVDFTYEGQRYHQRFEHGEPVGSLKAVGQAQSQLRTICFKPDSTILETIELEVNDFVSRFKSDSCDLGNCSITFQDKLNNTTIDLLSATAV